MGFDRDRETEGLPQGVGDRGVFPPSAWVRLVKGHGQQNQNEAAAPVGHLMRSGSAVSAFRTC